MKTKNATERETDLEEAGRVLSAANEKALRDAMATIERVLGQVASEGASTEARAEALAEVTRTLQLAEAELSYDQRKMAVRAAILAGVPAHPPCYCYIQEMYDATVVYRMEMSGGDGGAYGSTLYQRDYEIADDGAVTLGDPVAVRPEVSYVPVGEAAGEQGGDRDDESSDDGDDAENAEGDASGIAYLEESGEAEFAGDVIPLIEKAIGPDGSTRIKLIGPGWGTSGYYTVEALRRDGPKVWPKGTHQYINHATETEARQRPERDIKDLAAVLASDPIYEAAGVDGPGLYADAKVMSHWRPFLEEVAPHTGVSIRSNGRYREGVAEGRKGRIIEGLIGGPLTSVDFVTHAGAKGKVLQLYESARANVPQVTETKPPRTAPAKEARPMTEKATENWETQALREAQEKQATELAEMREALARERERSLLIEAREIVTSELARSELPDVTRTRLAESLVKAPPIEGGVLDKDAYVDAIREAVKSEVAYLASVGAGNGRIRGMGSGAGFPEDEVASAQTKLKEAFVRGGMSEAAASIAASGRR